jgi:TolB-like protein
MRHHPLFKTLCTIVLCLFSLATAQAGQVITREDRDWAKQAISQEAQVGAIDSSKSVAVLNFHNRTGQERLNALQKGLALMLITDLAKVETIIVVERVKMQALVDELALGESGLVDKATAPKVGKLLRAYYVVNGTIQEGSIEELELGSSILDVPFEIVSDLPPAAGRLDELFRMEKEVLFAIIEELNIYLSAEKKRQLEEPLSLSTAALLALFQGIHLSDQGSYAEAAEMYNRAIAEDPGLDVARDALQELNDLGLQSSKDVSRVEAKSEVPPPGEGGAGWGTVVAVGLGVAAIGGGIAALGSSSSDSDDDDDNRQPDPPRPPEQPTASINKTDGSCYNDTVLFSFSEPMNTTAGTAEISPSDFNIEYQGWNGSQTYIVEWENGSSICYSLSSITIELSNFVSAETGASLGGTTSFDITLTATP